MTVHSTRTARDRAAAAIAELLGAAPLPIKTSLPAAVRVPGLDLIVVAGDHYASLDFSRLRPLAIQTGADVIGLYVDAFRAGHDFVLDLVLHQRGTAVMHQAYRLWLAPGGLPVFVPEAEVSPAIAPGRKRLTTTKRLPFGTPFDRMTGLTRAQAKLDALIWRGAPFG